MGCRLVERRAVPDRGEHVQQRLVGGGGVVRGRARDQRDVGRARDRRAFRDQPAVRGMEVIADEQRGALAPEAFANEVRVAQRFAAIPVHQGIDHRAARSADDRDAVVERGGIHTGWIALDEQRGRGEAGPALGERAGGGSECGGALRRRQRRPCPGAGWSAPGGDRRRLQPVDDERLLPRNGGGRLETVDHQPWLAFDAGELGGTHRAAELAIPGPAAREEAKP